MKNLFLFLLLTLSASAHLYPYTLLRDLSLPSVFMDIKILDAKELDFESEKNIHELSGLAWCPEGLYALSDRGYLYLFHLKIKKQKIKKLKLLKSLPLRDKNGIVLHKVQRDSEDLSSYYNHLLISFERDNRVVEYSKGAIALHNVKLNKKLKRSELFQGKNKGLESVVYNRKYGIITAPEEPLKGTKKSYHTLYAKGEQWRFQAEGSITSLENIDDDTLLVLLRKYSFFSNRFTSLVRVHLDRCDKNRVCQSDLLAQFNSSNGWRIDNFEGVCKVGKNRYLMISDDNGSFFQKTLLVLFEIMN